MSGYDRMDQMDEGDEHHEDHFLVSCRCESAKILFTLLSCLNNISGSSEETKKRRAMSSTLQPMTVFVTAKSLSFQVFGKAKQIQASVDIQASFFRDYHTTSSVSNQGAAAAAAEDCQGAFCVNLSTVLECLQMLGTHHMERTKVSFSYNTDEELFKLEMIDEFSAYTVAAIPGMVPPSGEEGNALSAAFRSSNVAARVILKSRTLIEVMSELDLVHGATRVTLSLGRKQGLRLDAEGNYGKCSILVPVRGNHVVSSELPSDREGTPKNDYPLQVIKDGMKGLEIAEETCITMNHAGMIAIQHMVYDTTLSEEASFVDCILCSLCDEDSSDEDEDVASQATVVNHRQRGKTTPSPQSVAVSTKSLESQSHLIGKSKVTQLDEDDDEEEQAQSARLFGSVVGDASVSRASTSSNRKVRRRTRRQHASGNESDASRDLLANGNDSSDGTDSEVETSASMTLQRRAGTRNDRCPSPELVYGQQHH